MKILITHVYSRYNKGDTAILIAMLDQLANIFPKSQINILTLEKVDSSLNYKNHPILNSFFYYCIYKSNNFIYRILNTIYVLATSLVWSLIYRSFKINLRWLISKDIRDTCNVYSESDLVIPVGGGYINGKNTIQSNIALIILLHAILIAKILNKKVILYSQSIGPFSNKFQKIITKIVLNMTDGIFAREDYTVATLNSIGVNKKLVYRTVDAAFLFKTDQKSKMKIELNKLGIKNYSKLVGITVRKWLTPEKQAIFEKEIANFGIYLLKEEQMSVIFIPQVTDELHNDDDREVQKNISKHIGNLKNVHYLNKNYDHFQIKGIYENLDFLIGTRMHSVIFAITSKVPCIAIEYEYKTGGIMRDLKLSSYVIKIEDVTCDKLITLFKKIKKPQEGYIRKLDSSLRKYILRAQKANNYIEQIYKVNSDLNGINL